MRPHVVVIGVGSPLMGDDGIGIAALDLLRTRTLPDGVELVDGGTWGMSLLPVIEDAVRLLFLDAINIGAAPGTLVRLERDQLPRYFAQKLSPHQIDLKEVLAVAELRGTIPMETMALGIQPGVVDLQASLGQEAEDSLPLLVDLAEAQVRRWIAA